MRRLVLLVALVLGAVAGIHAQEGFEDPALNARYRDLIHTIRCMQCQNQSIADSPSDVAGDLRRLVREMMAAGRSDDEIRTYLAERYGDFILYKPPLSSKTWLLWSAPALLLLAGGIVFARTVRSRMQQPLDEELEAC
ncbi:MAG: cytochrome c-type biogenesis protein [Gammaproteobacteria bacterium]